MIKEFVDKFHANKDEIRKIFEKEHPGNYKEVVAAVVKNIDPGGACFDPPDPERIHEIDDGDCQGTLLFVIARKGYQPNVYWYIMIDYGSCSGCDTLQSIYDGVDYSQPPTKEQVDDYMTLALHVAQGLKRME